MALSLPAKALLSAYGAKHGGAPPPPVGIVYVMAQAIGEGSFSKYFLGTNNWGASHATLGWAKAHQNDRGYGMVAFRDRGQQGPYITRMRVLPSMAVGALSYLGDVEARVNLASITNAYDYAAAQYLGGWYTGENSPITPLKDRKKAAAEGKLLDGDLKNIEYYAKLLDRVVPTATSALAQAPGDPGDPTVYSAGPPFATLAERLTPSQAEEPHTLEHARQLLGRAADHPIPGTLSLQEALDAPGGDGVWMFPLPAPKVEPKPEPTPSTSSSSSSSTGRMLAIGALVVLAAAVPAGAAIVAERRKAAA